MSAWRFYRFSNDISYYADIGPGFRLAHVIGTVIGGNAILGENVIVANDVTIGALRTGDSSMPRIGNNVTIGTGARVLGNISIGDDVVIGALSFINKSVPERHTAYGIPPNVTIKPGGSVVGA